jgi:hypothetical protein
VPQFAQTGSRTEAHSSQNFAPAPFSCWHLGQIIWVSKKSHAGEGSVQDLGQQVGISVQCMLRRWLDLAVDPAGGPIALPYPVQPDLTRFLRQIPVGASGVRNAAYVVS